MIFFSIFCKSEENYNYIRDLENRPTSSFRPGLVEGASAWIRPTPTSRRQTFNFFIYIYMQRSIPKGSQRPVAGEFLFFSRRYYVVHRSRPSWKKLLKVTVVVVEFSEPLVRHIISSDINISRADGSFRLRRLFFFLPGANDRNSAAVIGRRRPGKPARVTNRVIEAQRGGPRKPVT